ncbi:hypothetical protein ACFQ88_04165 [Paenibacillus sp. NPDC056579]|uniref:hypothetical protein n=1 Tax=Paenibacillus sp. NPDC056579 TaxID=3345871 RepID=UPI0036CD994E
MRGRLFPVLCWVIALFIMIGFQAAAPVEAGFWDKVKDVYNMPDKVNELQEKYDSTMQQLSEQEQKLKEAQQYSEMLVSQNSELLKQLEQMKQERESNRRTWISIGAAVVLLIALYILSVRIWRFTVWRRQRSQGSGSTFGS